VGSLRRKLASYSEQGMHSFHTPGHKGRSDILSPLIFPDHDLTELPGLDMLHNPQGVIAEAQRKAAGIYGAGETFFLVNGATAGNHAMFMTLMNGQKGKKIRIERKAHRSVIGALILSGLEPEYIASVIHPDFGLPLGLDREEYCNIPEQVGAFHLTNPSYYGTAIDLDFIIQWRDKIMLAVPVLVDQAHGSHFKGDLFPKGAVDQGADIVVHSTHKTLAALTQAAMLHVQGNRIDKIALQKSLELLQTSSPSYLLMESLDNAVSHWNEYCWDDLYEEVMLLQKKLAGSLRILTKKDIGDFGVKDVDWTKILVNISTLEISSSDFVEILRSSFQIEPELWDENNILFLLGIGNKPEDVRILSEALESLVKRFGCLSSQGYGKAVIRKEHEFSWKELSKTKFLPSVRLTPREAWLAAKKAIKVKDCLGRIAGETISIYPPGIPLIAAGEEITPCVLHYLEQAGRYRWQGWQGFRQSEILIVDI